MIKKLLPEILTAIYKASDAIMDIYSQDFEVEFKGDKSPVTIADKTSSKILYECLEKTGIWVVSEEESNPAYIERKNDSIWLMDPLDGTKEFIKKNGEFCICIALIEKNSPVFGIIADPVRKRIIFGGNEVEAALIDYNEQNIFSSKFHLPQIQSETISHIIYSRTHHTPQIDQLLINLESHFGKIDRIKKGSALKFFDLVQNNAQVYPRLWPTMEWDIAAGQAIYEAVGGEVLEFTTFAKLQYNKESLFNPHFIAKPKKLNLL